MSGRKKSAKGGEVTRGIMLWVKIFTDPQQVKHSKYSPNWLPKSKRIYMEALDYYGNVNKQKISSKRASP